MTMINTFFAKGINYSILTQASKYVSKQILVDFHGTCKKLRKEVNDIYAKLIFFSQMAITRLWHDFQNYS